MARAARAPSPPGVVELRRTHTHMAQEPNSSGTGNQTHARSCGGPSLQGIVIGVGNALGHGRSGMHLSRAPPVHRDRSSNGHTRRRRHSAYRQSPVGDVDGAARSKRREVSRTNPWWHVPWHESADQPDHDHWHHANVANTNKISTSLFRSCVLLLSCKPRRRRNRPSQSFRVGSSCAAVRETVDPK